jgi:hypothetical protein
MKADELVTRKDLFEFQDQFLEKVLAIIKSSGNTTSDKKWLRSKDVRTMLGISPGTLQSLRTSGVLPYSRVRGTIFYSYDAVQKMLSSSS